ncbi:hypothetical protein IWX76_001222 [Pedobacter sp. CAN_A7]|uniref:hypothetical protein n=1 Tax=Pedobacter sp. CAN_A7 TaxID=2787722 RepID=UPI0018C8D76B
MARQINLSFTRHLYFSKFITFLLLCFLAGCSTSTSFDREVWIDNPDVANKYNHRAKMVQDVIKNHLKPGMPKKSLLNLLGRPYWEGTVRRLPKNTVLPDSISYANDENFKPENADKAMVAINKFYKLYGKPVLIMRYPVGWSTMDPNFLVIQLNSKQQVVEYWVSQG